ncbi:aspartate ammonia-lyase [Arthrobacter castelli]|uniref:aspartate ammonia-lyase n=1 Tax=Arthrobacter castelli TaxID=271431 RepID=UPI00047AB5A3|nr:aspartate ammonia-lyase [Arthrobacter castelli]
MTSDTPLMPENRTESDSLGSREVPGDVYWGISTLRAMENFPMTGRQVGSMRSMVWALGAIKYSAAQANGSLGLIPTEKAEAISTAAREVMDGNYDDQFMVDVIQGGAGTSTNMNANEVIANRALEIMGCAKGEYSVTHPIDHVNRCQSTNDVYPTAAKMAQSVEIQSLLYEHELLSNAMESRAVDFKGIFKVGRTQLQDAVPMTLAQEFRAFAATLREDQSRLQELQKHLLETNLAATAIGTGITAPEGYRVRVVHELAAISELPVIPAENLIEATSDAGVFILTSGILKRTAVKLSKICNDLRLLSSGPQSGFGEITLPAVQAGSSIMPGKVNPVIPEVVNQVAFRVVGVDAAVTMAVEAGQLQLNAFEPIIVEELFEATTLLTRACRQLRKLCIDGIEPNVETLSTRMHESISIVTGLAPHIGYATAAELAKEALLKRRSVLDLVFENKLLTQQELNQAIDLPLLARDS